MTPAGFDPFLSVELTALALAYLWGTRRVPRWEWSRTAAMLAGLLAVAVALGPLDAGADRLLSRHMLQHLVLIFVAPPLLLAGAPLRLLLAVLPTETGRRIVRVLRRPPFRDLMRPVVALALFATILLLTHIPAFYDEALSQPLVHGAEHLLYLLAGLVLWAPVLAPAPLPAGVSALGRILYLLVAMLPGAAVGLWLMTSATVRYSTYAERAGALGDQWQAGMVMWAGGSAVLALAVVGLGWRGILAEERRQQIRDAHLQRAPSAPSGAGEVRGR